MTTTNTAIIRTYVGAVTQLLLGKDRMKNGVSILGGDRLDPQDRKWLAETAAKSDFDIVYLEFDVTENGTFGLVGVNVAVPRDKGCYFYSNCRFWLRKGDRRGLIVPRPEVRGHFRLTPRELRHIDGKPGDAADGGIERADARIAELIRTGASVIGQVALHEYHVAA